MSDYIPFDMQIQIINKLPVRSLIQFRSVSKTWKSFIDSSEFIAGYGVRHTDPPRLLIRYEDLFDREDKYVSIIDDGNFSRQHFAPPVPVLTKKLTDSRVIGSSHGLLCSYGYYQDQIDPRFICRTEMVVLWNPSIRKSIGVAVPDVLDLPFETVVGFGVSPVTGDPAIVKITHIDLGREVRNRATPWQVQFFTLSSGNWRVLSNNLPRESIKVTWSQAVVDGFIYLFAFDRVFTTDDDVISTNNLILSFDLTTQEFRVIDLPDVLSHQLFVNLSISKIRESLGVFEYKTSIENQICDVWTMEDGVTRSFRKILTINAPYTLIKVLGFAKNGNAIIETVDDIEESAAVEVYKPASGQFSDLEIYGEDNSYFVSSYMETLLLLDQRDLTIYS